MDKIELRSKIELAELINRTNEEINQLKADRRNLKKQISNLSIECKKLRKLNLAKQRVSPSLNRSEMKLQRLQLRLSGYDEDVKGAEKIQAQLQQELKLVKKIQGIFETSVNPYKLQELDFIKRVGRVLGNCEKIKICLANLQKEIPGLSDSSSQLMVDLTAAIGSIEEPINLSKLFREGDIALDATGNNEFLSNKAKIFQKLASESMSMQSLGPDLSKVLSDFNGALQVCMRVSSGIVSKEIQTSGSLGGMRIKTEQYGNAFNPVRKSPKSYYPADQKKAGMIPQRQPGHV